MLSKEDARAPLQETKSAQKLIVQNDAGIRYAVPGRPVVYVRCRIGTMGCTVIKENARVVECGIRNAR